MQDFGCGLASTLCLRVGVRQTNCEVGPPLHQDQDTKASSKTDNVPHWDKQLKSPHHHMSDIRTLVAARTVNGILTGLGRQRVDHCLPDRTRRNSAQEQPYARGFMWRKKCLFTDDILLALNSFANRAYCSLHARECPWHDISGMTLPSGSGECSKDIY
jgi:hypothetical protein